MLELGVGRAPFLVRRFRSDRRLRPATSGIVGGDARGDREHPSLQVASVPERGVAAQCSEKGLLESVLCALPAEQAHEVAEHGVAVLLVEPLERRHAHGFHHALQRGHGGGCEMKVAVVGHVEVVEFVRVELVPRPGEIVQASETWTQAAGGGAVAAAELHRLSADTLFFTAFGDDEIGHRAERELRDLGLSVECVYRDEPQRRGFTFVDDDGERTITVIGRKLVAAGDDALPWTDLDDVAGLYFTGGDPAALREARRARVLVATARELPTLKEAGVQLDALVQSGTDEAERYRPGELDPAPRLVVTTDGRKGGHYVADGERGTWEAAPLPGPVVDAYGAGDSFAAGLTFALGEGRSTKDALDFAARSGAQAMTRRGAY
jgi:ribokinase